MHTTCSNKLNPTQPDGFSWSWPPSGVYSSSSTYRMLCHGMVRFVDANCIWKCWAPLKCKIFAWLAFQYELWTSDHRVRHRLQLEVPPFFVFSQEEDNLDHTLVQCVVAMETWSNCLSRLHPDIVMPLIMDNQQGWSTRSRKQLHGKARKGFDSEVMLISWNLLKLQNTWVFHNRDKQCLILP